MNVHIFASAILIAQVAPVSTPSPAPIHEIGHVRASSLCTTLRGHVRPAIAAMMNDDQLIGASHRGFAKTSQDLSYSSDTAVQFDTYYLRQVEERLIHNLDLIDSIMKKPAAVPGDTSADGREASDLDKRLSAVLKAQKDALNLLSGTLETESLGRMQGEYNHSMQNVTGQPSAQTSLPGATAATQSFIGTAGLPTDPSSTLANEPSLQPSLHGHNIYDAILGNLDTIQMTVAREETQTTAAVLSAVDECKGSIPEEPRPQAAPETAAPQTPALQTHAP